jgi:hypothetical protein
VIEDLHVEACGIGCLTLLDNHQIDHVLALSPR